MENRYCPKCMEYVDMYFNGSKRGIKYLKCPKCKRQYSENGRTYPLELQ
jgi:hypothetical protein